ncbi:MAG: glycosyltransferase family 39 protein [Anaerolineales bacterium]|nr:glycosyltransferase family 39 protein [Anaerolineales bacterium]
MIPVAYDNTNSSSWDQRDYLKIGLWISRGIGFTDSNRNPLYPLLLAPLATRDVRYFTMAKCVSLGIGCMGLVMTYYIARKYVGSVSALAVASLLMLNREYRYAAAHVDTEILLTPLFFAAWHSCCEALRSTVLGQDKGRCATIAGVLAGLAYLAKGTGLLIPAVFFGTLILLRGAKWLGNRRIWFFVLGFIVVALPLWAYHLLEHGNPLYNINTTHYMWNDSWEENFTYDLAELPTLFTYLQTHTVANAWERLSNGLRVAPTQWYRAIELAPLPLQPQLGATVVVGLGILVLIGVFKHAHDSWKGRGGHFVFSLSGILVYIVLFAWYHPISASPRFVLPWVPVLYLAPVWLLRRLVRVYRGWWEAGLLGLSTAAIIGTSVCGIDHLSLFRSMPTHDQEATKEDARFMGEILQRTSPGDNVVIGPSHLLPDWLAFDRNILLIPHTRQNWPTFQTWIIDRNAEYVVLDEELWERRRQLLGDFWVLTDQGLVAEETPPGWSLVVPTQYPCRVCLFHVDSAVLAPETVMDVVYEDEISLLGYTLDPRIPQAGSPLTLTLYWELEQALEETTQVFVHVLDSEGRLAAQHDGNLAVDLYYYPDEQLLAGTRLRDDHTLPALPPGSYVIHVGLYRWETQQRLAVTSPRECLSEQYLQLLDVELR